MADNRTPLRPRIGPAVLSCRLPALLRNTRIAQLIKITGALLLLRSISIRAKQQNIQRHPIILLPFSLLPPILSKSSCDGRGKHAATSSSLRDGTSPAKP